MKFWKNHRWRILLAGFAFVSCDTITPPSELSEVQGTWQLQAFELTAGSTILIPNGQDFTIQFDPDGSLGVKADCNLCGGVYETNGNSISIDVQFCTRAYCGDESLDNQYLQALANTSRYTREGRELLLDYSNGTLRYNVSQ